MSSRKDAKNILPYREWTTHEHATLIRMRQEGATVREIAAAVRRSYNAVIGRIYQHNIYAKVGAGASTPPLRVTIEKSKVPEFYEAGWRFAGFDGGQCVFERRAP